MNGPDYGLIDVIQSAGVVGLLTVIVLAFLKEWVVTRQRYLEEKREKEAWRALALHGAKISKDAVETLKGSR